MRRQRPAPRAAASPQRDAARKPPPARRPLSASRTRHRKCDACALECLFFRRLYDEMPAPAGKPAVLDVPAGYLARTCALALSAHVEARLPRRLGGRTERKRSFERGLRGRRVGELFEAKTHLGHHFRWPNTQGGTAGCHEV